MSAKKPERVLPEPELIGQPELGAICDASPTTLWRWRKTGRLPQPDKIIGGRPYWKRDTRPLTDAEMAARQQGDAA